LRPTRTRDACRAPSPPPPILLLPARAPHHLRLFLPRCPPLLPPPGHPFAPHPCLHGTGRCLAFVPGATHLGHSCARVKCSCVTRPGGRDIPDDPPLYAATLPRHPPPPTHPHTAHPTAWVSAGLLDRRAARRAGSVERLDHGAGGRSLSRASVDNVPAVDDTHYARSRGLQHVAVCG